MYKSLFLIKFIISVSICSFTCTYAQIKLVRVLPNLEPLKARSVAISPDGKKVILSLKDQQLFQTEMVNDSVCKELQPLDLILNKNKNEYVVGGIFFSYDGVSIYYNLLPRDIKAKILIMQYDLRTHTTKTVMEGYSMTSVFNEDFFLISENGKNIEKISNSGTSQLITIIDYSTPKGTEYLGTHILPNGKTLICTIGGAASYNAFTKERESNLTRYYISNLVDGKWTKPTPLKEININNCHHYRCSITLDYKIYFVTEEVDKKYNSQTFKPKDRYIYMGYLPKKYLAD